MNTENNTDTASAEVLEAARRAEISPAAAEGRVPITVFVTAATHAALTSASTAAGMPGMPLGYIIDAWAARPDRAAVLAAKLADAGLAVGAVAECFDHVDGSIVISDRVYVQVSTYAPQAWVTTTTRQGAKSSYGWLEARADSDIAGLLVDIRTALTAHEEL